MTSTEKDVRRDVASISFKEDGKSLSKNLMYAPLMAYEQAEVEPSNYVSSQTSVPKDLQESSLATFLQNSSYDYHRYHARPSDPKNNGSRPLSLGDMSERIRQKAVTLIGGGINSSLPSSTKKFSKLGKRRCRDWKDVEPVLRQHQKTSKVDTLRYLRQLNSYWNSYISSILMVNGASEKDVMSLKSSFIAARNTVELVGAHVRIASCTQMKQLTGILGVLIGETRSTWKVAILKRSKHTPKHRKEVQSDVKFIFVPKEGSTLMLIIPALPSTKDDQIFEADKDKGDLILKCERCLFITLDPNRKAV